MSDSQSKKRRWFSYKSSYNPESSGRSVSCKPIENIGGAERDRTADLLNAINPNLSGASYSWKKYPAFLTTESQQFFRLYQVLSQKIRTRFGQPQLFYHEKAFRKRTVHSQSVGRVIWLNGRDLRDLSLLERKKILRSVIP